MKKFLIFACTILIYSNFTYAQNKVDSLKSLLILEKNEDKKACLFLEIGQQLFNYSEYDSAYSYFQKSHELYKKTNNKKGISDIYLQYGLIKEYQSKYDTAFALYDKAIEMKKEINDLNGLGHVYQNIGVAYYYKGDYKKAIPYYEKSVEVKQELKDTIGLAGAYNNLGLVYSALNNYSKAIENYMASLNRYDLYKQVPRGKKDVYANIGTVYFGQKQYTKAIKYYKKCEEISTLYKDTFGIAVALDNIGSTHIELEEYKQAIDYLKQAKDLAERKQLYADFKANIYQNLALAQIRDKQFDDALKNIVISNQIYEKMNNQDQLAVGLNHLADINLKKENLQSAESALNKILAFTKKINKKTIARTYSLFAQLYEKKNDFKNAYSYHVKYKSVHDSLTNAKNKKQIVELQTKYETAEKEKENQKLVLENTIKQNEISEQKKLRNLYLLLFLIAFGSLILIFILYRIKNTSFKTLLTKNEALISKEDELNAIKELITRKEGNNQKQKISDDRKEELIAKIEYEFSINKIYTQHNLTLQKLSNLLKTNTAYLSQIINETYQNKFNDYINEFRIKDILKRIDNDEVKRYTIDTIAKSVGFNSNSTFQRAFKKYTGLTPAYYIKHKSSK